jgi:hypothetical protein
MNPEFQRNLYLEFSFARLIGMPLFLLVIFVLTYSLNHQQIDEDTANVALWLYIFIVLFWGARQAAESIFDELRNHTWDIQKTSAISPWSLTWGKLFGSTLFNWYGGIFCLTVYAIASEQPAHTFTVILFSLGLGLLVQALSLLISLFALRKKQASTQSFNYLFILFLLFTLPGFIFAVKDKSSYLLHWYGFEMNIQLFALISLGLACVWAIIGVYRLLAEELQIRTFPLVWLGFVAFLIIYVHGLIVGHEDHSITAPLNTHHNWLMLIAFAACSSLTYGLILIDNNNPMLMRRLWIYSQQENWQRFWEEVPCWLISLILTLPSSLYLTLTMPIEPVEKLHFFPLAAFLLMLRDVGIVLYFSYAQNPKRAFSLSLLFLTLLYWILPAIFATSDATVIAGLFLPLFYGHLGLAVVVALIHVAVIGYLLWQRWQKTVNYAHHLPDA